MNLNYFINQYGNFTFQEVPFTEIDNVIFANLSYVNFKNLISEKSYVKKTLYEVGEEFFSHYSSKNKNIYAVRKAIDLFKIIKDKKRYKDLLLYFYAYEVGEDEQFSAMTIEIHPKLLYVSFEGTDELISGWKEDFMFSYQFPTLSQRKAIDYVNRHFTFKNVKIILGGHSKGGNLALVSGMYANFFVKRKILNIYNNDGPGLLPKVYESRNYQSVSSRLVHIVPNYSIVGLILKHSDQYIVVRSNKKGIYAHDAMSWCVDNLKFERATLSSFSKILEEKMIGWLNQYNMDERKKFVNSLFSVFSMAGIKSIIDVFENKKLVFRFLHDARDIEPEIKVMIKSFIFIFIDALKESKVDEFKVMFSKGSK